MRFDWGSQLSHDSLNSIAEELRDSIAHKGSFRGVDKASRDKQILDICLKVISALYTNHFSFAEHKGVSFPRKKEIYNKSCTTGEKIRHSNTYAILVYDELVELKWVSIEKAVRHKNYARMTPINELAEKFNNIGFIWMPQQPLESSELVILKDVVRGDDGKIVKSKGKSKKSNLPLPDCELIEQHKSNLRIINKHLANQCISLAIKDEHIPLIHNRPYDDNANEYVNGLNLQSVQLSRIFARGSMEKGGRFYRGWWQHIPSIHRPHIRINGLKTDEIDFGGIAIRMLYSYAGTNFIGESDNKDKDAYDIGLPNWKGKADPRRGYIKQGLNALINDEDGVYKLELKAQVALKLKPDDFVTLVRERHKPIAHLFQSGAGLRAQYDDSRVAEIVMLNLISQGVTALPVHDSFIVRLGHRKELVNAMKDAYHQVIGQEINLSFEIVKTEAHFGIDKDDVIKRAESPDDTSIHVNGASLRAVISGKPSVMDSYAASHEAYLHNLNTLKRP